MKAILLLLFLVGCQSTPPIFSECPPAKPVLIEHAELNLGFEFRFKDEAGKPHHISYEQIDGWTAMIGLPEILNFDWIEAVFAEQGMESRYESNIIYFRPKQ